MSPNIIAQSPAGIIGATESGVSKNCEPSIKNAHRTKTIFPIFERGLCIWQTTFLAALIKLVRSPSFPCFSIFSPVSETLRSSESNRESASFKFIRVHVKNALNSTSRCASAGLLATAIRSQVIWGSISLINIRTKWLTFDLSSIGFPIRNLALSDKLDHLVGALSQFQSCRDSCDSPLTAPESTQPTAPAGCTLDGDTQ